MTDLFQTIVMEEIAKFQVDAILEEDIRNLLRHQYFVRQRPAQMADALGAAFSTLSLIEGLYGHIEQLVHKRYEENLRTSERANTSEDSDIGGGSR